MIKKPMYDEQVREWANKVASTIPFVEERVLPYAEEKLKLLEAPVLPTFGQIMKWEEEWMVLRTQGNKVLGTLLDLNKDLGLVPKNYRLYHLGPKKQMQSYIACITQ